MRGPSAGKQGAVFTFPQHPMTQNGMRLLPSKVRVQAMFVLR